MSERLNTQDLVDLLIKRQGLERKEAEVFVKEFFALIEEGLEKDKIVKVKGLGTFKLINVESRESVDVNTGERIEIKGHTKVTFAPDVALRDIINKPFAHFETVVLNDRAEEDSKSDDAVKVEEESVVPPVIQHVDETAPEIVETLEEKQENLEPVIEETQEEALQVQEEVNEEIEAVQENEVDESAEEMPQENAGKKKETNNNVLVLVVVLVTLLCLGLLFFTYFSDIFSSNNKTKVTPQQPIQEVVIPADTISSVAKTDSVMENKAAVPKTPKAEKQTPKKVTTQSTNGRIPFSQIPVYPDSTSYEIVGTKFLHTVREGESLIRISYRYYGTKDLYPYLIMYNRSTVHDPDHIPYGTSIKVPELRKK